MSSFAKNYNTFIILINKLISYIIQINTKYIYIF